MDVCIASVDEDGTGSPILIKIWSNYTFEYNYNSQTSSHRESMYPMQSHFKTWMPVLSGIHAKVD